MWVEDFEGYRNAFVKHLIVHYIVKQIEELFYGFAAVAIVNHVTELIRAALSIL